MSERLEWPQLAEWFDRLQGDAGDPWHRLIIFPGIMKVIGDVSGLDVLDVGCGNGSLARILARGGNRVTGVDASPGIIERAREREAAAPLGISYQVAPGEQLAMFPDSRFDLVVSCMALIDMEDAAGAIREMGRVVKRSGRCVMLFSHPCFDIPGASTWLIEKEAGREFRASRRISRYRETFEAWVEWSETPGLHPETHTYHRSLSWYFRAIAAAGMAVTMLDEPEPTAEFVAQTASGKWVEQIPMHVVIEARPFANPTFGHSNGRG